MLDYTSINSLNVLSAIVRTDSYKLSHYLQYPEGTEYVRSYIEARGGEFDQVVFFGLQAFIKAYLTKPITMDDIELANEITSLHGVPFNYDGWMYILKEHDGYLPIEIEAVPEGTPMAPGNVQVQVVNTDPKVPWLTSYVETALLRAIWYPSTVATVSRFVKGIIRQGLEMTSDNADNELPFKLHDFGGRGASSSETAMLGGMGHLVNFMGSDTLEAVVGARMFYGAHMAGFSIPATEHSTITSWGREGELAAFENLLDKHPTGLVACVSDSYDLFRAVGVYWGEKLRDKIMARDGTLVIRPDSGNPITVPADTIELLMEKFGFSVNAKGFKVLPPQVRVIQGDGMTPETISQLVSVLYERGLSVDNIAFGMGGGLLQKVDRDTLKYAMKACEAYVNGVWIDVYKDPITDPGKRSKRGKQALVRRDGELTTIPVSMLGRGAHGNERNYLRPVFRNGKLLVDMSFDEVRENAR